MTTAVVTQSNRTIGLLTEDMRIGCGSTTSTPLRLDTRRKADSRMRKYILRQRPYRMHVQITQRSLIPTHIRHLIQGENFRYRTLNPSIITPISLHTESEGENIQIRRSIQLIVTIAESNEPMTTSTTITELDPSHQQPYVVVDWAAATNRRSLKDAEVLLKKKFEKGIPPIRKMSQYTETATRKLTHTTPHTPHTTDH